MFVTTTTVYDHFSCNSDLLFSPIAVFGGLGTAQSCLLYIISAPCEVKSATDCMEGGITTLIIVNLHPLVRLLGLWFEGIPGVVQRTKDAISNHPLLHCSIFDIEL